MSAWIFSGSALFLLVFSAMAVAAQNESDATMFTTCSEHAFNLSHNNNKLLSIVGFFNFTSCR